MNHRIWGIGQGDYDDDYDARPETARLLPLTSINKISTSSLLYIIEQKINITFYYHYYYYYYHYHHHHHLLNRDFQTNGH